MTETIDKAVALLNDRATAEIDGTVKFMIADTGTIVLDSHGARAEDGAADVTLSADADTFRDILEGRLDPTSAFLSGRLSVDGDMALAMKLGAALS